MRKKAEANKRDKSPVIQVNLTKENQKTPKAARASLNLAKVLETRKQNVSSLWDPPEGKKFENYFQRHSRNSSNALKTDRSSRSTNRNTTDISMHRANATEIFTNRSKAESQANSSKIVDSPSPTKNEDLTCPKHQNRQTLQPRKVRYVCCENECEM